jgi:AraC-like DNA-binding protein
MAPTDPISDVLRAVRLTGGVFLDARSTARLSISANMDAGDCKPFLATPAQLIAFHVIIEGRLKLNLRETRKSIAQVAHLVGYESEEAFSRAFKREFGVPPATWRDQVSAA